MCFHRIDDKRRFFVFLTKICTNLDMGTFNLMVDGFSDIMQKSGTFCHADIHTDLTCQKSGKLCHLDGMFQCILSITGTELHPSQQSDQFWMDAVNTHFQCSCFSFLTDHGLNLFAGFLNHLLNPGRMDSSVHDQFFQCNSGNLSSNRIKS